MTKNSTYIKNGYVCNYKDYNHVCLNCGKDFTSHKSKQKYCSKSCSANMTANRRIEDCNVFKDGVCDEFTAYLLGLIYSDGSISCDKINLTMNDKEMMEMIHSRMTPNKKLYKNRNSYSVISSNKDDLEFLKSLGITTNKSYDARLPKFDINIMKHRIRGWFDGDGSVYKSTTTNKKIGYSKTYTRVSFTTGSLKCAEDIKEFLGTINIDSRLNKDCRKDTWYIRINKVADVNRFKEFIYDGATIYLDRKYDKFNNDIV